MNAARPVHGARWQRIGRAKVLVSSGAAPKFALLFGSGFGIGTDIQTGPRGDLFVVSTSLGAVFEIHRATQGED